VVYFFGPPCIIHSETDITENLRLLLVLFFISFFQCLPRLLSSRIAIASIIICLIFSCPAPK